MSDQVLSDEQRLAVYDAGKGELGDYHAGLRAVERATISALAARIEVDVEALAAGTMTNYCGTSIVEPPHEHGIACTRMIADAIRLALAATEARHAERERVLRLLWSWIENWSPDFTEDDEWDDTESAVRAALRLA